MCSCSHISTGRPATVKYFHENSSKCMHNVFIYSYIQTSQAHLKGRSASSPSPRPLPPSLGARPSMTVAHRSRTTTFRSASRRAPPGNRSAVRCSRTSQPRTWRTMRTMWCESLPKTSMESAHHSRSGKPFWWRVHSVSVWLVVANLKICIDWLQIWED